VLIKTGDSILLERLKKRERVILYLTFVVVIFSLMYNFLLEPIVERYRLLNQEVIKNKVKLQKYLSLLSQKERIKQDFAKISEGLKTDYSEQESISLRLSPNQPKISEPIKNFL
jgi:type II secretory pathway component PulM